jgi:hypothetical protein
MLERTFARQSPTSEPSEEGSGRVRSVKARLRGLLKKSLCNKGLTSIGSKIPSKINRASVPVGERVRPGRTFRRIKIPGLLAPKRRFFAGSRISASAPAKPTPQHSSNGPPSRILKSGFWDSCSFWRSLASVFRCHHAAASPPAIAEAAATAATRSHPGVRTGSVCGFEVDGFKSVVIDLFIAHCC